MPPFAPPARPLEGEGHPGWEELVVGRQTYSWGDWASACFLEALLLFWAVMKDLSSVLFLRFDGTCQNFEEAGRSLLALPQLDHVFPLLRASWVTFISLSVLWKLLTVPSWHFEAEVEEAILRGLGEEVGPMGVEWSLPQIFCKLPPLSYTERCLEAFCGKQYLLFFLLSNYMLPGWTYQLPYETLPSVYSQSQNGIFSWWK